MQGKEDYRMYYKAEPGELEEIANRVERLLKDLDEPRYHTVLRILAWRRPWRPKHVGWANVKDQILHLVYALAVFSPAIFCPSYFTAGLGGFFLGVVREWEQWRELDLKILMIWDRLLDVAFFVLGALMIYAIKVACFGQPF